jgi:hypothetical protein
MMQGIMDMITTSYQMLAGRNGSEALSRSVLLQRQISEQDNRTTAPSPLDDVLRSPGAPLDAATRGYFEPRFDADFSQVRVHTDARAAASARSVRALAYTVADDVVFGTGQYAPNSAAGRKLLAHELGHVAQQRLGGTAPSGQAENRARAAADRVADGASVTPDDLGGAPRGLYRNPDEPGGKPEALPWPTIRPLPKLNLSTPGPAEWLKMQATLGAHGRRLSLRDADDILRERERSSKLLDALGIDDRFKLWFITKQWILNKGIQLQLEDWQTRENPNAIDRLNSDWKNAHPGRLQTPILPIFQRNF